jgi:hypothetical protein
MIRSITFMAFFSCTCALLAYRPQAFADDKKADDKKTEDKKVEHDPKSNNKDKIFGKWKITEVPEDAGGKTVEQLASLEIYFFVEFKADGGLVFGLTSDKPEVLEQIQRTAPKGKLALNAKYKLLAGEDVELFDIPKELQETGAVFGKNKDSVKTKVKLDGDKMTMIDDGKTSKLTRIKEEKKDKKEVKPEK